MTIIYLAARYSRRLELCGYRAELQAAGFEVAGRWLDGGHQLSNAGDPIGEHGENLVEAGGHEAAELRLKFAIDDLQDVSRAEHLIAFTEEPRASNSRGDRHVVLGIAIGRGIPVSIVGPRENIFCWLPGVLQFPSWEAFRALSGARP